MKRYGGRVNGKIVHYNSAAEAYAAGAQDVWGPDGRPCTKQGQSIRVCGECGGNVWYDGTDRRCTAGCRRDQD